MYDVNEKICNFYVSREHLVTALIPYIYNNLKNENKIETFFEDDLEEILNKINLNLNYDRNILNTVDWKNLKREELSKKFESENNIVIVAGKSDFIKRLNSIIVNFHTNFTLVNCYDLNEIAGNYMEILNKYSKVLSTKGIEDVKKLFTV